MESVLDSGVYEFPRQPFESIAVALSGGGFRAAAFGLGVLSLLEDVKIPGQNSLLKQVKFVSSASGGTITLSVYKASLHQGIPFNDFYHHLNSQITGESLVQKAIHILNDDNEWRGNKSRNLINAFAKAYHTDLFSIVKEEKNRTLGGIMKPGPETPVHIEEFCFNASEFYTGLTFRFQAANRDWKQKSGPQLGNDRIGIDWKSAEESAATLKNIRLADILAASSCFPMGFEPIMYPADFTYAGGPTVEELKKAIHMETYSWDDKKSDEENGRSRRAKKEHQFASAETFGLMDGGICDNQGLGSLLTANDRIRPGNGNDKQKNKFDLILVSDVTSFYMSPYNEPPIPQKEWMKQTPADLWNKAKGLYQRVPRWFLAAEVISLLIAIGLSLPLILEGNSVASVILTVVGFIPLLIIVGLHLVFRRFLKKHSKIVGAFLQEGLGDLFRYFFGEAKFASRTTAKVIQYLQCTPINVTLKMILSRGLSAATMIGDVFLKHIRRLIYDKLYYDQQFFYRRKNNTIYKLAYSNNKNRQSPHFDPRGDEPVIEYNRRKASFIKEIENCCRISPAMQDAAEVAYSTKTTLWFESEEETGPGINPRKAVIATGQFTTCYDLLEYSLSLKYSRHFGQLEPVYWERIEAVVTQLKTLMECFYSNPYHLYEKLADARTQHPGQ